MSLINLAGHLLAIDPVYCNFVSTIYLNQCIANDGVVPYTSQEYPGAPNLYMEGPAHTQERQQGDAALYQALVWYTPVSWRPAPPPAPPPNPVNEPEPPDSPGSAPDWDSPSSSTVYVDQALHPGESIWSDNGLYRLRYDESGDLVLLDEAGGYPMWTSGTQGSSPGIALMQSDGNFVIYDTNGGVCWASGTVNYPGAVLVLQDDGNLVIYGEGGWALWATGTVR
jgi:hypothetical protein